MKTSAFLAAIVAAALLPSRADAQNIKLQIQDGRVTLEAQNVPVRQILAEWARVGGAKIVNGEKVAGAPLTLQIQSMPERQALDIILRGVSGYMLAARQQAGTGVSAFDRIMILPTSSAPPRNAGGPMPGGTFGRPMPAPAMPVQAEPVEEEVVAADGDEVDNDDPEPEEEQEVNGGEGEPTAGAQPPQMNRFQRRNVFPNPMGAQMQQPFVPQQGGVQVFPGQQQQDDGEAAEGEQQATPGNPFGMPAGATATPGVVTPVPQQPGQPGQRPRRPPS